MKKYSVKYMTADGMVNGCYVNVSCPSSAVEYYIMKALQSYGEQVTEIKSFREVTK